MAFGAASLRVPRAHASPARYRRFYEEVLRLGAIAPCILRPLHNEGNRHARMWRVRSCHEEGTWTFAPT